MMGICQRNDSVLQIWSIISSIVFLVLFTQGFGINFVNPFTAEIAQLLGFSYIDDCNTIQSDGNIEAT